MPNRHGPCATENRPSFGPLWHGREIRVEVWVHSMRAHLAIVVELQAAAADRVHDGRVVHYAHRNVCREIAHSSGCDIPSVCTEPPQVRLAWPAGARAAMKTKSGLRPVVFGSQGWSTSVNLGSCFRGARHEQAELHHARPRRALCGAVQVFSCRVQGPEFTQGSTPISRP